MLHAPQGLNALAQAVFFCSIRNGDEYESEDEDEGP